MWLLEVRKTNRPIIDSGKVINRPNNKVDNRLKGRTHENKSDKFKKE
jgi:hypothetical protein